MEFIEDQVNRFPDLAALLEEIGKLYQRKLWHELSVALEALLKSPAFMRTGLYVPMYTNFISKFDTKMSPIKLANIVSIVGQSMDTPSEALEFFNQVLATPKLTEDAVFCISLDVANAKLLLGETEAARKVLEDSKDKLSSISASESAVYSKFYRAQSEFKKRMGPAHEFYKSALMYLSYTSLEDMTESEKYALATDMVIAAVSSDEIYNFGEVLQTPLLQFLKGTPNEWLFDLITALNKGNVVAFNEVMHRNQKVFLEQPALAANLDTIKRKAVFMTLMRIVFERSAHDRTISFGDIAEATCLPLIEVEWVLMKALSIGLIKGTIDGVDQSIDVTWVLPTVLNKDQLQVLEQQLEQWSERVKTAFNTMELQTPELLV